MQGIYIITNLQNNKCYIGQASNIEQRWNQHKKYFLDDYHKNSCPKLYRAFEKYGIENFKFEIIEYITDSNILTEREEYWIRHFNSIEDGYNCIYPTEVLKGENNPNATLTLEQVIEIKKLLINSKISQQDIATQYNVAASTVYRINKGEIWNDCNENYPLRTWNELAHCGEKSGRSKLTDEEVMKIRKRYVNESPADIWQDYKELYSLSGFSKICRGETYKHLPIYKKIHKNLDFKPVETISCCGRVRELLICRGKSEHDDGLANQSENIVRH